MTKSVNNVKVSLSRLALAKALKTPDESEQHQQQRRQLEDSWENSIIFYQSHISHEMLQQLIDGDRSVHREHILRHFGSKIAPQEHWQHPENKNNKVSSMMIHPSITLTESVTTTGMNSIGGTSNYSGNDNNYYSKSTSSSSTCKSLFFLFIVVPFCFCFSPLSAR